MKKLYSIGETSKITGVSVQTLRNYSNGELLRPAYVNPENGYRYFTFEQFHRIDRIKYLRSLGVSLSEIKKIYSVDTVEDIIAFLKNRSAGIEVEINALAEKKRNLDWYTEYFSYHCRSEDHKLPHIARFGERLILAADCGSPLNTEETEIRITALKTEYQAKGFAYLRQYGYLLPFDDLLNQQWRPDKHFTYCAKTPPGYPFDRDANLIALPPGDYFCCSFRLRHLEELNVPLLRGFFEGRQPPAFVIANEYEDNLTDFRYCPYELQFFLREA